MNYCTLEEAWGMIPKKNKTRMNNSDKNNKKNKNNINENFENYKSVKFENSELYNPYGENIYGSNIPDKNEDNSNRFDFSRGINKLSKTNGKNKRVSLPPINIQEEEEYISDKNNGIGEQEELEVFNTSEEQDKNINNSISDDINNKLAYIIKQIENNSNLDLESDSNNINDLLLFIFTGVFFIFILDIFVKIGKKINY